MVPPSLRRLAAALVLCCLHATSQAAQPEVRGTWLTTTANRALASPADSAAAMQRLREIGLNTVYVESWKNGYTQFPSAVLERTIGHRQRPAAMEQDPSDSAAQRAAPARDLMEETLIEAHRNGLVYISWFEYGFMAAYKDTMNDLRRQKPEWLSRDIKGSELAPNGFVWLNPLHPEARRFLLDLVLEAVDRYDLDGVQLDDRIVWPYVTMGYDEYTQHAYAAEHDGRRPPADHRDPEWMRWRAAKVNAFSRQFVREVRARRPGLVISLSPGIHPWAWEHYLLDWPRWSGWPSAGGERWDEFIPQAYRHSYAAFERTWLDQVAAVRTDGGNRQRDLLAGIRIVGDGPDSDWDQLRRSIELARREGNGGHVLWFSRGVLDLYPAELTAFYRASGAARSPHFPEGWRRPSVPLQRSGGVRGAGQRWIVPALPPGRYRAVGHDGSRWHYLDALAPGVRSVRLDPRFRRVEVLLDRRKDMMHLQRPQK
jgi:uncharacterized lipoprotein YddW (UPF0748 family)